MWFSSITFNWNIFCLLLCVYVYVQVKNGHVSVLIFSMWHVQLHNLHVCIYGLCKTMGQDVSMLYMCMEDSYNCNKGYTWCAWHSHSIRSLKVQCTSIAQSSEFRLMCMLLIDSNWCRQMKVARFSRMNKCKLNPLISS